MSFLPSALRGSFAEHVKKQAGQERLRALSSDQAVEVAALMMQTAVKVLGTGGSFRDMNEVRLLGGGYQREHGPIRLFRPCAVKQMAQIDNKNKIFLLLMFAYDAYC
jgi:hypothetical protein